MPYPTQNPTQKHDLLLPCDFPSSNIAKSSFHLTSIEALQDKLQPSVVATVLPSRSLCFVCSYPDAPSIPLSRAWTVIATAPRDLWQSFFNTTSNNNSNNNNNNSSNQWRMCTLAVRRGDGPHVLLDKHLTNSPQFVQFMGQLQQEGLVAILELDKHGRFGILISEGTLDPQITESYCATCHIGTMEIIQQYKNNKHNNNNNNNNNNNHHDDHHHHPPTSPMDNSSMWQPPTDTNDDHDNDQGFDMSWQPTGSENTYTDGNTNKRKSSHDDHDNNTTTFHQDSGAAAADAFYSGLTRSLDTRSDSRLFHMRSFNGWVKATQIQELDPKTGTKPLRILDLACGKGGDLGKWVLHSRGIRNYVGVDVARGSLRDAALRARKMKHKLPRATFTVADLGADVPGRLRTKTSQHRQALFTWSMQEETGSEAKEDPIFRNIRGGGIAVEDTFDIVSIQFAIHYMFSSRDRARRFFQTVSELLEVGGNLIATTIDARIVLDKVMGLGLDLHHYDVQKDEGALVTAGGGVCRIQFTPEKTKKIFDAVRTTNGTFDGEELFGLEYTFTLVEGSDHGAGVGDAVNLPEWLNPIPVLQSLAAEAGLELESAENFHEFFSNRKDPSKCAIAHHALYNMKVLDRNGSIPPDNWDVSRLYCALKFRKVRESKMVLDEDDEPVDEEEAPLPPTKVVVKSETLATDSKLLPMAMMKAKKIVGDRWNALGADEKKELIQVELDNLSGW